VRPADPESLSLIVRPEVEVTKRCLPLREAPFDLDEQLVEVGFRCLGDEAQPDLTFVLGRAP
jgi:hypothetical protein